MASSMTGFSRQDQRGPWGYAAWEMRSLNHRFLEVSVHLPKELGGLEQRCRELIGERVQRGKITCMLHFEATESFAPSFQINAELMRAVIKAAEQVQPLLERAAAVDPLQILRWPGVCEPVVPDLGPLSDLLLQLLESCLDGLNEDRRREGEELARGVGERCDFIAEILHALRQGAPELAQRANHKLQVQSQQLSIKLQPERLEQELVILLQKSDIEEELDRLEFYLKEVQGLLQKDEPIGKHLNFLMQELHREINTIGSKLTFIGGDDPSVRLKVLTEQMREQVQNIE